MKRREKFAYLYGWLRGRMLSLSTLNDIDDVDELKDKLIEAVNEAERMWREGIPEVSNGGNDKTE